MENIFAVSVAARASSSSSSSLSSVSSSSSSSYAAAPSSSSIWGMAGATGHGTSNNTSSLFFANGSNNHVAATTAMMSEETATTSSHGTNASGASFLLPNRFDVGYGRSSNGYKKYNQNPTSFAGAVGSASCGSTHRSTNTLPQRQHQYPLQYREKQGADDDAAMDMG